MVRALAQTVRGEVSSLCWSYILFLVCFRLFIRNIIFIIT